MSQTKILITGSTGFIGKHVLDELAKINHIEIHCFNKSRPRENKSNKNIIHHTVDLLNFSREESVKIKSLLEKIKPTHCLHLAWYTGHQDYLTSELNHDWEKASIQLIDNFYNAGGERFMGIGTCIEYDLSHSPLKEIETPLHPTTLYAQSKIHVLNHLHKLQSEKFSNFLWARIFFVYGPNEQPTRLLPYVVNALLNNKIVKPNNGLALRNYTYVKDLAKQLVLLLQKDNITGEINTGNEVSITINSLFSEIGRMLHKSNLIELDHTPLHISVPEKIEPDLTLFNSFIPNFKCTTLEESLTEILENRIK